MKIIFATLCILFSLTLSRSYAQHSLPETHYKVRTAKEVMKRIFHAWGMNQVPPELSLYTKNHLIAHDQLACYYAEGNRISLGEKLYDLCASMGKDSLDALACVIGHEVGHYIRGHQHVHVYGLSSANTTSERHFDAEMATHESQADADGLFYGFLAGFNTYKIMPKVIASIYKTYQLNAEIDGYPSLSERMAQVRNTIVNDADLVATFQAGEFLFTQQRYEEAAYCFEYVLGKYPAREIYNNAALSLLQQVAEKTNLSKPFLLPCMFDQSVMLTGSLALRSGRNGEDAEKRSIWLEKAKDQLRKALLMDPGYPAAHTNLALALLLEHNLAGAIGQVNELEKVLAAKSLPLIAPAQMLRGIAYALDQQVAKAEKDLKAANAQPTPISQHNLEVLLADDQSMLDRVYQMLSTLFHTSENTSVFLEESPAFPVYAKGKPDCTINPTKKVPLTIKMYNLGQSGSVMEISTPKQVYTAHLKNYKDGQTLLPGVTFGDSVKNLEKLGKPKLIYNMGNDFLLAFPNHEIVVRVGQDKIVGWTVYR